MENENTEIVARERKQFNATYTQVRSFQEITKNELRRNQKSKVLLALESNKPCSMRMLSKITGIEVTAISRCLTDLRQNQPPLAKMVFVDASEITGKKVQFYTHINWLPKEGEQIKMFSDAGEIKAG